ncbi:NAD(P)H-quinone oxidoreductase subunit 5 [Sulfurivirga caldicuralii]|uniref:Probable inorganic carbon transporter subunit DabB n=1 Tax=Sulfurivirga caldicuralii TaxID=364032 RepID=A0A1N6DJU6_9GAMM|nr:NADH-quinone oxidoreductase subunit L [Sulfurivirga caldicuralii]SIN71062.1 NAD(P)H-quinone oxidoreductase subunit 5 [Sulfurivirga caldicuralii]
MLAQLNTLIEWLIPASLIAASIVNDQKVRWDVAIGVAAAGLVFSVLLLVEHVLGVLPAGTGWLFPATASFVMLVLVMFIGLINLYFSRSYMASTRFEELRYVRWVLVVLASVVLVVISNHMLLLMVGWIGISVSLNRLLLFYPNRPRAVLAAHKKFLFSRFAEVLLFVGFVLLHATYDTWLISDVLAYWQMTGETPAAVAWAVVLIALAGLIKCAQMPFHGWLIQVVEAPTPVSTLLHAGIVNLGGYLMIVFAPLLMAVEAAQWVLVVVGGLTAVLAGLIMMTRASVKVRLAWSTLAQMGLLLVECGLGLFELAMLHLVAHSLYKAYSFFNSGSEVTQSLTRWIVPSVLPTWRDWLVALAFSLIVVLVIKEVVDPEGVLAPWLLAASSLAIFVAERHGRPVDVPLLQRLGVGVVIILAYVVQKHIFDLVSPDGALTLGAGTDMFVSLLVVLYLAGYWVILYGSNSTQISRIRRALYAGFYLDEWSTRLSLRIYPVTLPTEHNPRGLRLGKEEFANE